MLSTGWASEFGQQAGGPQADAAAGPQAENPVPGWVRKFKAQTQRERAGLQAEPVQQQPAWVGEFVEQRQSEGAADASSSWAEQFAQGTEQVRACA